MIGVILQYFAGLLLASCRLILLCPVFTLGFMFVGETSEGGIVSYTPPHGDKKYGNKKCSAPIAK